MSDISLPKDDIKKFETTVENVKNSTRELWQSMITIHATILGISIALMSYLENEPSFWLTSTWVLQITSIGIGFTIFKLDIDKEFKQGMDRMQFSFDMNEYREKQTKGEFANKEEDRQGLFVAAMMKNEENTLGAVGSYWTPNCKAMYEKYKPQLTSSKLFVDVELSGLNKIKRELSRNLTKLTGAFYILTIFAFIALLVNVLVR